jgi:nucleoside-diphosphate-sugar epimerase
MKILITGGNGYIAKSLYNGLKDKYNITLITREDFDLIDSIATYNWFKDKKFDIIIHTAVVGGSRLKPENTSVIDQNLQMYYNLLECKDKFTKFLHFGSGAEIHAQDTPYGLSKHVIRQSILDKDNFYNLRIFAVFDENELDTRFIKSNIKKYINKEPIEIHQNKFMDFFYMKDLVMLVDYCILNNNIPKEINCIYNNVCTLEKIAMLINELDKHKVSIIKVDPNEGKGYYGGKDWLYLPFIGLEQGIKEMYNKLKNEY